MKLWIPENNIWIPTKFWVLGNVIQNNIVLGQIIIQMSVQ